MNPLDVLGGVQRKLIPHGILGDLDLDGDHA